MKSIHARNEAFDCRVYALAVPHGLRFYGFDLDQAAAQVDLFDVSAPALKREATI